MKFVTQCFMIIFIAFYSSNIDAVEDIQLAYQTGKIKSEISNKHAEMLFKVQEKRDMYNRLNSNGRSFLSKELGIINDVEFSSFNNDMNIDSSLTFYEFDDSADYYTIQLPEFDLIPRSQTPQLDLEHTIIDHDNVDITFNILPPKHLK